MHARNFSMLLTAVLMALGTVFYSSSYSATLPLSAEEEADLLFMREEEKLARDVYLTFYDLYEGLTVFSNIASSEQNHMDAMLKLLKKYKLGDPAAGKEIGEFTNSDLQHLYDHTLIPWGETSALDALAVGALIEEKDMVDIQAAIERSQQAHIDAVYATLLCGSRNHLRSFVQNIEALGGTYIPQDFSDPNQIAEILSSPMEKCNKSAPVNECRGKCLGWTK